MEWQKKECILEAAARAFTRMGFKKASVEDIAREAGVAKGTVYLACDSKADLLYQAVHRELRAWSATVAKMIDPRVPADVLLEQVAVASFAYLESHPLVKELFLGNYSGQLPDWTEQFNALRSLGHANISEILRTGIRQGLFRADLDVEETAYVLQELHVSGCLALVQRRAKAEEITRRLKAGMVLVFEGLRARPAATVVSG